MASAFLYHSAIGVRPMVSEGGISSFQQDPCFDEVFTAVYNELRRLAACLRRHERHSTLATTEIVDEAYLKLRASVLTGNPPVANDRIHFKRIATCAMRQILTDAARRRTSGKRGGDAIRVTLSDAVGIVVACDVSLLDLDRRLDEFSRMAPRSAEAVEMHFFGGFTIPEIAAYLNLSESTVSRDLRAAIAWLQTGLTPGGRGKTP